MRVLAHIAVAFLLLVVTGTVWRITPFHVIVPDIALIFALHLGITAGRSPISHATMGVIWIGYFADVLSGSPRFMSAAVLGAICILCRLASGRLLVRGRLFIAAFSFVGAMAAHLLLVGLRLYFGAGAGPALDELFMIAGTALLTAVVAPAIFRLCRAIDAKFARTEREREAVREGYLT
jgi:hypothetical protein